MSVLTLNTRMSWWDEQTSLSWEKCQLLFILEMNCDQILSLNSVYIWRTPENQTWDCEFQFQHKSGSKNNSDRCSESWCTEKTVSKRMRNELQDGCKCVTPSCSLTGLTIIFCLCITAPLFYFNFTVFLATLPGLTDEVDYLNLRLEQNSTYLCRQDGWFKSKLIQRFIQISHLNR